MTVSIPGAGVETPQLRSSDISPQSLSPSQIKRAGIQRPLSHWNPSGPHVAAANNKHDLSLLLIFLSIAMSPDHCKEFWQLTAVLVQRHSFNLPDRVPRHKYNRDSVGLRPNWLNLLANFAQPLNLTGAKKSEIWFWFSTPVAFHAI